MTFWRTPLLDTTFSSVQVIRKITPDDQESAGVLRSFILSSIDSDVVHGSSPLDSMLRKLLRHNLIYFNSCTLRGVFHKKKYAVSTVPVPASKNFTLNCRYRHFKQKLNDAGMDALST